MQSINLKAISEEASETFNGFICTLQSVEDKKFNMIPFEGSWTAAQVGDHVQQFLNGVTKVGEQPVEQPARHYDDFIQPLRQLFLNFDIRMKSPDFVAPSNEPVDKELLIMQLKDTSGKILHLIAEEDLTLLCKGFELPTMGELTRLEWAYFGIYHTQRHTHQLQNIITHLS